MYLRTGSIGNRYINFTTIISLNLDMVLSLELQPILPSFKKMGDLD